MGHSLNSDRKRKWLCLLRFLKILNSIALFFLWALIKTTVQIFWQLQFDLNLHRLILGLHSENTIPTFFFVSITIEWSKKWVMEQSKIVKEIELKYCRDALYVDYLLWKIIDLQRIGPESPWKIIFCVVCSVHRKTFLSGFYRRPVRHWWHGRV